MIVASMILLGAFSLFCYGAEPYAPIIIYNYEQCPIEVWLLFKSVDNLCEWSSSCIEVPTMTKQPCAVMKILKKVEDYNRDCDPKDQMRLDCLMVQRCLPQTDDDSAFHNNPLAEENRKFVITNTPSVGYENDTMIRRSILIIKPHDASPSSCTLPQS